MITSNVLKFFQLINLQTLNLIFEIAHFPCVNFFKNNLTSSNLRQKVEQPSHNRQSSRQHERESNRWIEKATCNMPDCQGHTGNS